MALLPEPHNPNEQLHNLVDEFPFQGPPTDSDAAVALVIQDTERAEKFLETRLWVSEWRNCKVLYEAPVQIQYWRDTVVPRASNPYALVSQHVRPILDMAMKAVFAGNPPFAIRPTLATPWAIAEAHEQILKVQAQATSLREQSRLMLKDALIFGTGIGKWGWEMVKVKRHIFERKADPMQIPSGIPGQPPMIVETAESEELKETVIEETISRPYFRRVEVNHLLVDPTLRVPDIREAKYVVHRDFLSIRELNELRGYEGWNIPSEEELRSLVEPPAEKAPDDPLENESFVNPLQGHRPLPRYLDSSNDPMDHKLEVLERWDNESVMVVLQRKVLIRNEANPFSAIPFVSCFWDDLPGCFYSFGIARRIGPVQMHMQGLRNARLDEISLGLMPMWKVQRGTNSATQPIRMYPGAFIFEDGKDSITPLERQPVLPDAYREEEVLTLDAEKTTGANEMLIQGTMPQRSRSSMGRTATGAAALAEASNSRIQSFVDCFLTQAFIPVISSFLKMNRQRLPLTMARALTGTSQWAQYEEALGGEFLWSFRNSADLEVEPLAGSDMGAKRALGQTLPIEIQLFSSPAVQESLQAAGKTVNWLEMMRRLEQVTGWKSLQSILTDVTPQQQQQRVASNPEFIKAQATKQRVAQIHQQKMQQISAQNEAKIQQIDAQGVAKAAQYILTKAMERAYTAPETQQFREGLGVPQESPGGMT